MRIKSILLSIAAITASFSSSGALISSNGLCDTNSVQITSIETNPGGTAVSGISYPISATQCLGYITDPGNDWGNSPSPNNGLLGEGLLNQELNKDGGYIPGDFFLTHPNDRMVDLDGDGNATDPGWIRLGGDPDIDDGLAFEYDSINGYNLSQVITMDFSLNGNWSLTVDPTAIPFATNALGRPTIFDHLAFVMKGPNPNSGSPESGWAVYDFNFYELIDSGLNISLGDTAYTFAGTWDSNGIFDGKDLSHFSVWAHDPPGITNVDEPAMFGLFSLSIALLMWRKKKLLK